MSFNHEDFETEEEDDDLKLVKKLNQKKQIKIQRMILKKIKMRKHLQMTKTI